MIWSFSTYRQFKRCQRQWFYKNVYGNSRCNDPSRNEAFILGQLKSLSAWRGDVVDKTLSNFIIPSINSKKALNLADSISYAKKLCRRQLDFAKLKSYRDGKAKSNSGLDYCALFPLEYDIPISTDDLKELWREIESSLANFHKNELILRYLITSSKLLAQRPLIFQVGEISLRGVPDLIAFYEKEPPRIIDWKVHSFGTKAYDEQLIIYALALSRCKPHVDFPTSLTSFKVESFNISEYQMLLDVVRDYEITSDRLEDVESMIDASLLDMNLSGAMKKINETEVNAFETTKFPENCQTCAFKKICWERTE